MKRLDRVRSVTVRPHLHPVRTHSVNAYQEALALAQAGDLVVVLPGVLDGVGTVGIAHFPVRANGAVCGGCFPEVAVEAALVGAEALRTRGMEIPD